MTEATIQYTAAAPAGHRNGVVIGAGKFGLNTDAFRVQHGSFEAVDYGEGVEFYNELVPTNVTIQNGRGQGFELEKHGFELHEAQLAPFADVDSYYRELEAVAQKKFGAASVKAFCHAARGRSEGFGTWAHTDHAVGSWSGALGDAPVEKLPPGLEPADVRRASEARRWAVVSAWRYLGPAPTCRQSHLAVLDARSLAGPDDYVHFEIRTNGWAGHNYRLKAARDELATNDRHQWWYFPDMARDSELLFFVVFDSKPSFDAHCAVPTVFHAAFFDPNPPPQEPDRQSIDVRLLLTWD